jgi:hypothetical protein
MGEQNEPGNWKEQEPECRREGACQESRRDVFGLVPSSHCSFEFMGSHDEARRLLKGVK